MTKYQVEHAWLDNIEAAHKSDVVPIIINHFHERDGFKYYFMCVLIT
jgi:hypothetical protein